MYMYILYESEATGWLGTWIEVHILICQRREEKKANNGKERCVRGQGENDRRLEQERNAWRSQALDYERQRMKDRERDARVQR